MNKKYVKFTLIGFGLGLLLPITAIFLVFFTTDTPISGEGFVQIHKDNILLWILYPTPFIVAYIFFRNLKINLSLIGARKKIQKEFEEAMIKKQRELHEAVEREHNLLVNSAEIITIFDTSGNITYMSPSVENVLGYYQYDLVGKPFNSIIHQDFINNYKQLIDDIKTSKEAQTLQVKLKLKDDTSIWVESTARNKINDSSIQGILINFVDITERRQAEKEQKMRGKMQALSENSPDLIVRLTNEYEISYINPAIEVLTPNKKEEFLNKKLSNTPLPDQLTKHWKECIEKVKSTNKHATKDFVLEIDEGVFYLSIRVMPEYDDALKTDIPDSFLLVSHDITTLKETELEVLKKNNQINASINYAKRIQEAIIPDNDLIEKELGKTAMFYKPKDVVSGDFPYYYNKDGYMYYAAVDCTGHGVPGAMMSLIGHLLLNDILNNPGLPEPGEVLTELHNRVVKTLNQDDPDNTAADGMDIAFCRISPDRSEVLYSGAHRPLYHLQQGEIIQLKGNKFPVGGMQYSRRKPFKTYNVNPQKGDSIYFFSDGYPDQFGGERGLKFGPKRIRQIIESRHTENVESTIEFFENEFHNWLLEGKQIDDVLFIGIEF